MFPHADPLLILAVVVLAGLAGGAITHLIRLGHVPGQILAGVLIGHAGLAVFEDSDVTGLQPITHFGLGVIVAVVGGHLNLRRLRNARKRLLLLLAAEITITPLIVYAAVVHLADAPWSTGWLLAALAISTAPATVVAIVAETRSKGVFVKTLIGAVALNNIACIVMFEVARMAAQVDLSAVDHSLGDFVWQPFRQLLLAGLIGGGFGSALVILTRRVFQSDRLATASVLAVLLSTGLAQAVDASPLLACLFLGVTLANLTPAKDEIVESAFVNVRDAIFAVFFTLAGMHLDLEHIGAAGALALLLFGGRILGKLAAARLALGLAGATDRVRRFMGMALIPQAGVAVGLLLVVQDDPVLAPIASQVLTVGLTVVTLNEIIGPVLVRTALFRSGETGHDRARLIDFLHEENIVTNFQAASKEEAIEKLVDVLISSNRLEADRDRLLATVLDREAEMSTCFGDGLAVPHGLLEAGDMVGAMGISHDGLPFETPDGVPVHCMVVLVTPPHQRERHLQVMAALARAIGTNRAVQRQLFAADSAAHAYEILHIEEAHDFNYFLDDDEGELSPVAT